MLKLLLVLQNSFVKTSSPLLFLIPGVSLKAQDLILNPDFSDITIVYQNDKKIYPKNWKSFDWPFPLFYHPDYSKTEHEFDLPTKNINRNGIIGISIFPPCEGIITKLKSVLEARQVYNIDIELRIKRLPQSVDLNNPTYATTGQKVNASELFFNYVVSLITFFSSTEPNTNSTEDRQFVIFDFPPGITPDSTRWIKLSKSYTASGNEQFFAIGTGNSDNYIKILKENNSDTTDYKKIISYYLIRRVRITPHLYDDTVNVKLVDSFSSDSLLLTSKVQKLVLRNITFDLESFDLNEYSKRELNKIAIFLINNPQIKLKITGHTDTTGTEKYNQELAEERAHSVYNYLINQGMDKTRFSYEGKGETQPLFEDKQMESFWKNRRVEFEFYRE